MANYIGVTVNRLNGTDGLTHLYLKSQWYTLCGVKNTDIANGIPAVRPASCQGCRDALLGKLFDEVLWEFSETS